MKVSLPRWDDFYLTRSYGIFYLNSIKKFVMLLEKNWSNSFYNKQWRKAIMQNICSYNKKKLIKENSIPPLAGLAHKIFTRKIFISPRWDLGNIKWDLT